MIPACNKDSILEDDYVPINSTLIRDKIIKDYKNYLDYLIVTNIIESNNQYIKGERSYGYRFTEQYADKELKRVSYIGHQFKQIESIPSKIINSDNEEVSNPLLNYDYLKYWYEQKGLIIDFESASKFVNDYTNKKVKDGYTTWKDKKGTKNKKIHPRTQKRAILFNLYSLADHNYNAKIDTNVHRLHTVITNMESIYRNFITYRGQRLVNIDIKNSQPYLATVLFKPEFWDNNSLEFNYTQLPTNIQSILNNDNNSLYIMLGNYVRGLDRNEVNSYIDKVSRGQFYEYIIELVRSRLGEDINRDNAKTMMFEVFFSQNKYLNQPMYRHKKMFSEIHPNIYEVFRLIKSVEHNTLACLLQSIESQIILHKCCKRVWEEGHSNTPIFTIHDSIVTTVDNVNLVKNIMLEELTNTIAHRL